ncbi:ANTR protein, partial [Mionectes macconnelli]|nr:ANTR protein [Mionectes macconnelli]
VTLSFGLVLTVAVTSCLCRPVAEAGGAVGDPHQHPPSGGGRDWPEYLSQEGGDLLSQFLPHVLGGASSSGWAQLGGGNHQGFVREDEGGGALHEHYYPDWRGGGRRSAEDAAGGG